MSTDDFRMISDDFRKKSLPLLPTKRFPTLPHVDPSPGGLEHKTMSKNGARLLDSVKFKPIAQKGCEI